jgi:hypothetical protein
VRREINANKAQQQKKVNKTFAMQTGGACARSLWQGETFRVTHSFSHFRFYAEAGKTMLSH